MKTICSVFCMLISFIAISQTVSIDSIITKQSLISTVSALAHDSMQGRFTAKPETKKAATFIASRFKEAGLNSLAGNDAFFAYFPLKLSENGVETLMQAINVIGAIKGKIITDTIIIFCAHYDHIGTKQADNWSRDKDSVYNGANDNASGVALLIELAKYYAALKTNRYTLVFIAFSGEEIGLLGSAYTAATIDQSYINAVINFDMVGRPISSYTKKCMVIAEKSKALIKKLNAQVTPKKFFISDQFPMESLFTRSDHYSFTQVDKRIFFTSGAPRDGYYHTLKDEIFTIDFDFLLEATKNIADGCKIFIE